MSRNKLNRGGSWGKYPYKLADPVSVEWMDQFFDGHAELNLVAYKCTISCFSISLQLGICRSIQKHPNFGVGQEEGGFDGIGIAGGECPSGILPAPASRYGNPHGSGQILLEYVALIHF